LSVLGNTFRFIPCSNLLNDRIIAYAVGVGL
jgi:hypothetical protein